MSSLCFLGLVLLQLLGREILLKVALIARQRQTVCDTCQMGYGPTVLLHLSGLLLHMHRVAAGESEGFKVGQRCQYRAIKTDISEF